MNFSNIKVIVFDLDGTLYEDTHHFDFQANLLKKRLPLEKQPLFEKDYALYKEGKHPLKIGRVFDVINDYILIQTDNIVQDAFDWFGNKIPENQVKELYENPIELNLTTMLSIGDPWWVSIAIAAHYGLDEKSCYAAFLETRNYMMSPDFIMNPIDGLKEMLERLKDYCKLVLLTNSPEPDSEAILKKLGIEDVFHLKIFDGRKPTRTVDHFKYIKDYFQVPFEQIVSIGDNWINEIRPVLPFGCKTILLDPYQIGEQAKADLIVNKLKEALPYLQACIPAK